MGMKMLDILSLAIIFSYLFSSVRCACDVPVKIESGWVCGTRLWGESGVIYASYRGVPYAKQPLGELRFKELQPADPWATPLDATVEGPVCPQQDFFFGPLMQPRNMSEACIHANIHIPATALPQYRPPNAKGLPVLVFIHAGGFRYGSGDTDIYGPEYMVTKNVVIVTFNYRLGFLGFATLNTAQIPGNNGLRDQVTLLKWVKRNIAAFGGDPDNVTLGGNCAGANSAHLLSLSKATEGLFKRVILMSGTATMPYFYIKQGRAVKVSRAFIRALGIKAKDPVEIHRQLTKVPIEKILAINKIFHASDDSMYAENVFNPIIESEFRGVTRIVDDKPEVLVSQGRGKQYPMLLGFNSDTIEAFRPRFEDIGMNTLNELFQRNPSGILTPFTSDKLEPSKSKIMADLILQRYTANGTFTIDEFIRYGTDVYYTRPSIKLAEWRAVLGHAPLFLYEFAYNSLDNPVRVARGLSGYNGASLFEDAAYVFRINSFLGGYVSFPPQNNDDRMKELMITYFSNFMKCGQPLCQSYSSWLPVNKQRPQYMYLDAPLSRYIDVKDDEKDMVQFFDTLDALIRL